MQKSTLASEQLEDFRKLQLANATRWNSKLTMIQSLLRIPLPVLQKLQSPYIPTAYELKILGEFAEIIEPFKEVTDRIQGEKIVTSSMVIICTRGLRAALQELQLTYNSKLLSSLKSSLEKRLQQYEEMACFKLAATLDPRFKLDWCTEEEVPQIRSLLTSTASHHHPGQPSSADESSSAPPPRKRSKLFGFMATRSLPVQSSATESPATTEIHNYLSQATLPEDTDPLSYWKEQHHSLPLLSKLACKYLSIPASSAPVERLFSIAGKVFRPERCRLGDAHFEQLMLIRCNNK